MKHAKAVIPHYETEITALEFIKYYNQNVPSGFPRASIALLLKFRSSHTNLFKHGDVWTIDMHRKKVMDWLPLNFSILKVSSQRIDK